MVVRVSGIDFVSGFDEFVVVNRARALKREPAGRASAVSVAMLITETLKYLALFSATERTRDFFPCLGLEFLIRGRERGCHQ